uniref:Vesicular acetylcholine transporter n=1 Tax=Aceria tosichella TaxID=561515 RepID=A0A6G1SGC0_9ACAR
MEDNTTATSATERASAANLQQQNQNRYAHLVASSNNNSRVQTFALPAQDQHQQHPNQRHHANGHQATGCGSKPPLLKEAAGLGPGGAAGRPAGGGGGGVGSFGPQRHVQSGQNKNYYYQSFSGVDWREQWRMLKEKTLEKVEEPKCQRKLIMLIVCTALLLDNMLYMVIVPIIPDYLRSIGSWSTYTENAKWIRRNMSHGRAKWEQVGGQTVYEGEDSAVGFLFASKAIVQLIANPFSGAIADRIGYEIPMMFGLTVMFLSTMVFACGQTYSVLFLARSLQGVGSAFADTPGIAMLADRFTEETERRRAQGIAIAFISFGCLVAPPFGSVLYQGAGKEVPFILLSLVCLIDGSLLLLVAPPGTFSVLWPSNYYNRANAQANSQAVSNTKQVSTTTTTSRESQDIEARSKPMMDTDQSQQQQVTIPAGGQSQDQTQGINTNQTAEKKRALLRQKSISRRHSMTLSAGEAPKGTPIEVLLKDPCIACCAGALVVANISLAFLEPTISIWVKNTMPDTEEWQEGLIWLPAFFPHVLGVFATLHFAEKYPQATWKIAASGLVIEGLGCIMVPFCSSFWSLIIPISVICFGVALIDTAILPTLGYLVDTRFTSVYGNVYAIADISYSVSYAIGPIIAGGIVEAIGFTALNFLIAVVTLGYAPSLMMLRTVRDYEPFEADQTGRQKELAQPFGKFGRAPIDEEDEEQEERGEDEYEDEENRMDSGRGAYQRDCGVGAAAAGPPVRGATNSSFKKSGPQAGGPRAQKSVKIIESSSQGGGGDQQQQQWSQSYQQQPHQSYGSNPFQ